MAFLDIWTLDGIVVYLGKLIQHFEMLLICFKFVTIKTMQILSLENISLLDNSAKGVYRIFLCNMDGNPLEIQRLIGIDYSGLMYIGSSEINSIQYRLKCFLHSLDVTRKQNNHSGGLKICNNPNIQRFLVNKQLGFDFIVENESRNLERELLKSYRNEFGEVPPLNGWSKLSRI